MKQKVDIQKGHAYELRWVDSCGTPAGWVDLSENDYPTDVTLVTTYGMVINTSPDSVVVV